MKVQDIEIPYEGERSKRYRFFEMLPGLLTWTVLILPFVLSQTNPRLTVFLILTYLILWFVRSLAIAMRAIQGYNRITKFQKLNWGKLLDELEAVKGDGTNSKQLKWHHANLARLEGRPSPVKPSELVHALIIATYNESKEILEPTIQSVLASNYDMKKVIIILAYEARGGAQSEQASLDLVEKYKNKFMHAAAIKHPELPGEIHGKGGNITYAGRALEKYLKEKNIDPIRVVVTTLDADNRPDVNYLPALSYVYAACPDPVHISFQPPVMFTNNIWDAPAPMRVVATGNTFWNVTLMMRPHMLRNFSSHAQSMQTLIDTNFWSVRTVVEDGHQFWRTYFRYDGNHEVYPIYVPIYQDAVLNKGYIKTLKAQFIQIRRWAWGASDVAYVAEKGFFSENKVPKLDMVFKFARLLEGHVTWAIAPLLIAFSSFVPALISPKDYAAVQLPVLASRIETVALVGIFATLFIRLKTLPPKPARYKAHRNIFMIIQWVYLPVTTVLYNSMAALYSQNRLMFGKYLDNFDFTEKAVKTEDNKTID